MAYGSGLSAQFGFAAETTYGTRVAPAKFLEFTSEGIGLEIARIESSALRAGTRVQRSDRWVSGPHQAGGPIVLEIQNKGMGLLWKHALGTIATTGPLGTQTYEHKATLGDPYGLGLTVQIGRPSVDGTVRPFEYAGSKIVNWKLTGEVGKAPELTLEFASKDEDTAQSLASASYATGLAVISWAGVTLKIAGSAYDCQKIEIDCAHKLKTDRYKLGAVSREQPIAEGFTEITGSVESEFLDLTAYNRFVSGTNAAVIASFKGALIETTYYFETEVTLAYVRFDGETPKVSGPGVLAQPLKFKALDDGTADSPIKVVYRTTDTTP